MAAQAGADANLNSEWKLDPAYNGRRIHEELLQNEYLATEIIEEKQSFTLRRLLEHCYDVVPYYQSAFSRLGIRRKQLRDAEILTQLPFLTKQSVAAETANLHARHLPPGNTFLGHTQTSGTTGEPLVIRHSQLSLGITRWLKQREYRWFRMGPAGAMLEIRPNIDLPRGREGALLARGEIAQLPAWNTLQGLFLTGKMWGFANTNSVEDQMQLLEKIQPAYLLMQASCLEYLSLQHPSKAVQEKLRGALSISQTLTPNMRSSIEQALQAPVHQNYGLNEIGIVASRCIEGGRYHVHAENCLVELLDSAGKPVAPGESGKLFVTSLTNYAMPLLRYDTDDIAVAVEGNCECGRTLPSFGAVQGRYRRTAFLPPGTFQRWAAIQLALYNQVRKQKKSVRKYQAIQDKCGDFELRIDCAESVLDAVRSELISAFTHAYLDSPVPEFSIVRTQDFVQGTGHKFQNFLSAFSPEMDQ